MEVSEQSGSGATNNEQTEAELKSETQPFEKDSVLDKLNGTKKAKLDNSIYSSFLHPKLIKTETIPIQSAKKVQKGKGVKQSNEIQPTKTLSHKFQFAD